MPIRITDDNFIYLNDLQCDLQIDYTFNKHILALQRVLNKALVFFQLNNFLLDQVPLIEDGVYGIKTKTRQRKIFDTQHLTPCNLAEILYFGKLVTALNITDTFIINIIDLFKMVKPVIEPPPPPDGTTTSNVPVLIFAGFILYKILNR